MAVRKRCLDEFTVLSIDGSRTFTLSKQRQLLSDGKLDLLTNSKEGSPTPGRCRVNRGSTSNGMLTCDPNTGKVGSHSQCEFRNS